MAVMDRFFIIRQSAANGHFCPLPFTTCISCTCFHVRFFTYVIQYNTKGGVIRIGVPNGVCEFEKKKEKSYVRHYVRQSTRQTPRWRMDMTYAVEMLLCHVVNILHYVVPQPLLQHTGRATVLVLYTVHSSTCSNVDTLVVHATC